MKAAGLELELELGLADWQAGGWTGANDLGWACTLYC